MEKAPMPRWLKAVIAIVACAIVLVGYSALSVALGFKHGGGYLVLILLFSLLGGIWRAIVGPNKDKNGDSAQIKDGFNPPDNPSTDDPFDRIDDSVSIQSERGEEEVASLTPQDLKIDSSSSKPDYHIVLKVLLVILMFVGVIVMIYQVVNDFTWENYTVGWIRLISSLVGLGGFILLYLKKLSGYIIIVSVLLFSIVYGAIMHDSNLGMIVIAALFRLIVISLFLFIRKDGISAWSILLHRHSATLNELKETFPVKPFVYLEKTQEEMPASPEQTKNNFEDWLKS